MERRREMQEGSEVGEMMRPMMNLQQRINRVFEDFFEGGPMESVGSLMSGGSMQPRMDLSETAEAFHITADVPGMTEDDIEITVSDNNLAISGERSEEYEEDEENFFRRERTYGMFHRRVPLPQNVERDDINATFKNGVLRIEMPKSEEAKGNWRKVEVQSEG